MGLVLIYDFSIIRCTFENNHRHHGLIGAEGRVVDCRFSGSVDNNGNAVRNVHFMSCEWSDAAETAFRNDHVGENLVFDSCTFASSKKAAVFETAIGPVGFRRCSFTGNAIAAGLSSAHNFSFDSCSFVDNDSCLQM